MARLITKGSSKVAGGKAEQVALAWGVHGARRTGGLGVDRGGLASQGYGAHCTDWGPRGILGTVRLAQ